MAAAEEVAADLAKYKKKASAATERAENSRRETEKGSDQLAKSERQLAETEHHLSLQLAEARQQVGATTRELVEARQALVDREASVRRVRRRSRCVSLNVP